MLSEKTPGRTQLASSTPEFAQLEYDLQLTLHASTVRIVAAYAISNPHVSVQFERRSKVSKLVLNLILGIFEMSRQ